jgi:PPOX class probable F420-dependent enzyme
MDPMTQALSDEIRAFLEAANPAVISTVRPDGQPVSVATWYLLDGDRILVNMDGGRKRLDYLREDPRVSLTVLDAVDWYKHVSVQGRVVEWRDDEDLSDIDRLARQYGRDAYHNRERPRVSAWIEVEHSHTWAPRSRR